MRRRLRNNNSALKFKTWKEYQVQQKRTAKTNQLISSFKKLTAVLLLSIFVIYGFVSIFNGVAGEPVQQGEKKSEQKKSLSKNEVKSLLSGNTLVNLEEKTFTIASDGKDFLVETSLDIPLQHFILEKLNPATSRYIGIVAMDPSTGRVLSMVGFDKTDRSNNPCIDNSFPAASIFKIVTAAAAMEQCDFNPDSRLTYNGRKYTLYKSQLENRQNKYTNKITLRDSFAQSVNPVFGKIGSLYLGKAPLVKYATAFGFNKTINFEIPLEPSYSHVTDEPYQWAEIACGFNRKTQMSPVHGALITTAILNNGMLIEPTVVDNILNENKASVYQNDLVTINRAISQKTSKLVNNLMGATIKSGTCRKAFRGYKKDKILSRLNIGGKSGSINNKVHDMRYDWFVGFAEEKKGPGKLVLSIIVAHEKYIGTRASRYARIIMKRYFKNYFVQKESKQSKA